MKMQPWRLRRAMSTYNSVGEVPWNNIKKSWNLSDSLSRFIWMRNLDDDELTWRLNPTWQRITSPFLLSGIDKAISRIGRAIVHQEKVCIYGDYDADGVTATALLVRVFEKIGVKVDFFIPNRFEDGYGINIKNLVELTVKQKPSLMISVDCGIRSIEEVNFSHELGIDWIITDHHTLGTKLPNACAVIHPGLDSYCNPNLSGVGVAFKLAQAIVMNFFQCSLQKKHFFLDNLLKLVALGTLADMVPLVGENALLVKRGLMAINKINGPGLTELIKLSKIEGNIRSQHISFNIAPYLNSVGRMGRAENAVKLLLTRDIIEARELVKHVQSVNTERKNVQRNLSLLLPPPSSNKIDFIVEPSAHKGVIGIVAGQRMRISCKPSIIGTIEDNTIACSIRAPHGYDMRLIIDELQPYLKSGGGHRYAASITFYKDQLFNVRNIMEKMIFEQEQNIVEPIVLIDNIGTSSGLSLQDLEQIEPFGQSFPEPLSMVAGYLTAPVNSFGKEYVKFRLKDEKLDFVIFSQKDLRLGLDKKLFLAVSPMDNIRWGRSWRVDALLDS